MNSFFSYLHKISPEKFFLFAATGFGLLILFITPPFQVPDEPNHFYKAWQISDGVFVSIKKDRRVGGYLPASFPFLVVPFERIMWSKKNKFSAVKSQEVMPVKAEGKLQFYDFNNTALYSPVCYAPQAAAIFLLKLFNPPVIYTFYAARLLSFFTWLVILYFAIKIIPVHKWLFTLLALLPTSLFINMSLSADLMTNALCFFFTAYVLKLTFEEASVSKGRLVLLYTLAILVASVKIVYTPLLLLVLIIPRTQFRSPVKYAVTMAGVLITGLIVVLFWSNLISQLYIPYEQYDPGYRDKAALSVPANMYKQLAYLKQDPSRYFSVVFNSIHDCSVSHLEGYIGLFGWLDTKLPDWLLYLLYLILFIIAAGEGDKSRYISRRQKLIFAGTFSAILVVLFLSQYLSWIEVGAPSVPYIHGRYLIPFYPLLFMLFNGLYPGKKIVAPLVICTCILTLAYTFFILYNRYV